MRCPNCQSEQNQTHFFCSSCGHDLHHSAAHQLKTPAETDFKEVIAQRVADFKREAGIIETETFGNVQKRIANWVKLTFGLFILSFSLMGYFGYGKLTDLQAVVADKMFLVEELATEMEGAKEQIKELVIDTKKATEQAQQETKTSLEQAHLLKVKIDSYDFESIQEQFNNMTQLEKKLAGALTDTNNALIKLTKERENVQILNHSFFSISLHVDGNKDLLADSLIPSLSNEGFQISEANLVVIGVNKTEILYYNEIARNQAEMIAAIVQESFALKHPITYRSIPMLDRNPREILIKIKLP